MSTSQGASKVENLLFKKDLGDQEILLKLCVLIYMWLFLFVFIKMQQILHNFVDEHNNFFDLHY